MCFQFGLFRGFCLGVLFGVLFVCSFLPFSFGILVLFRHDCLLLQAVFLS